MLKFVNFVQKEAVTLHKCRIFIFMLNHMKVCQVIVLSAIKHLNQQLHLISIKNVHSVKNIFCETCDKQFSTNPNLNKHMKLHSVTITPEIKDS